MIKKSILCAFIVLLILIVGCARKANPTAIQTAVPPQATNSFIDTSTSVSPSTATTPTLLVKTVIPSTILPPTPINTLTTPTLLPLDLARTRLLDLLANNGGCLLSCLWGITPGASTYVDAENILAPLANIADPIFMHLSSSPGSINLNYVEDDAEIDTNVSYLYGNDGIITDMEFQVRYMKRPVAPGDGYQDIFDSKTFDERAHAYMLPQVLNELGIPAAVLIQTSPVPVEFTGGFRIILFYPEQGLLINYETKMQIVGDKVRGCPIGMHVELVLTPPGHPDTYSKFLDQTKWASLWPPSESDNLFWKPIEIATSMSLDQFYKIFSKDTNMCIETPASIWPTL